MRSLLEHDHEHQLFVKQCEAIISIVRAAQAGDPRAIEQVWIWGANGAAPIVLAEELAS